MKRVDFNFAHSAQGYMKRSSEVGAACGSGDKPSEETEKRKPTACVVPLVVPVTNRQKKLKKESQQLVVPLVVLVIKNLK